MTQVDRTSGLTGSLAIKTPCRAATTANITLSGEQTIDGVALVTDDRVLVKNQTDQTENGIYIVDTGNWERAQDFDGSRDVVQGTLVPVYSGTVSGSTVYRLTTANDVDIETDNITFALALNQFNGASAFFQTLIDDTSASALLTTIGFPAIMGAMGVPLNFSMLVSVGASALTIAVKGADGNNPSATNPVYVPFRSGTTGAIVWRPITSALSLVISSGSTLGHNSGLKQYIYVYLIDNAGTVEVAASSKFFGWHGVTTTTAEGGAGAADTGTTIYSAAARASVAFSCVALTEDTQAAAGTWATTPSAVRLAPFDHPLISFSAHKNGTNQVGLADGADTKVTFATEVYDNGALFDSVTNTRWVPPPGSVEIKAAIKMVTFTDANTVLVQIFKNGLLYKSAFDRASSANTTAAYINVRDECSGTDYYEVFVNQSAGAAEDVNGTASATWFQGFWTPQRS